MNPRPAMNPTRLLRLLLPLLLAPLGLRAQGKADLRVTSDPSGAAVLVNGTPSGSTPVELKGTPAGTMLLVVRKEGFEEIRRSVPLLDGQKVVEEFKLEPLRGLALVHSTPEGAEVSLNGAFRGRTPLLITDCPLGEHRLALSSPGYQTRESTFTVKDRRPVKVILDLVSDAGMLEVAGTPAGASVLVDGQAAGTVPYHQERITKGTHTVQVKLDGYEPFRTEVTVNPGEKQVVTVNLAAIPGQLQILSIPTGGRVYVNDLFKGNAPLKLESVDPGTLRVRVEMEGYESMARDVEVRTGQPGSEEFRLARNTAYFELITEPSGVKVIVDGEDLGETTSKGSDAISDILRIYTLKPGDHTLQLTKKGYAHPGKRFTLTPGKPAVLREKLSRLYIPDTLVRTGDGVDGSIECMILQKLPNGDLEVMTGPGTKRVIAASKIISTEPLKVTQP